MATATFPPETAHMLDVFKSRRTIYRLTRDIPITDEQLLELVKDAVKAAPSAYQSQTTRVCVLRGKHHENLWCMVKAALGALTSPEQAAKAAGRIESCFQSGGGTILFFEDERAMRDVVSSAEFCGGGKPNEDDFHHTLGLSNCAAAQFVVWSVLTQAGVAASLQHYQTLVAEDVRKAFCIPPWWRLDALMPFGGAGQDAGAKSYIPMTTRFLVHDEDGLSSYGGSGSSRENDGESACSIERPDHPEAVDEL